jgi:kynurenine formamidase
VVWLKCEGVVRRYIDLSGTLENDLWSYSVLPGLEKLIPPVLIETIATVKNNDFFASKITCSSVSGTYLEAGSHIRNNGKNLDRYGVEDFIKPAAVIRLPQQEGKTLVDGKLLAAHAPSIERGDAVLIDTGWGGRWNRPGYVLQCPNLSRDAVEWVLSHDISIFGIDIPCIESSWSEDVSEEKGGLLALVFERDVLLTAPLINLDRIKARRGMLICLPLAVAGTSGAPVRVVFEEEG